MKKWSWKERRHRAYEIPKEWNCKIWGYNLNERVNCAECGREMALGMTYESLEIVDDKLWLGYGICKECYEKEIERRERYSEK